MVNIGQSRLISVKRRLISVKQLIFLWGQALLFISNEWIFSNNALCSACLSFTMFIFLLTPFGTWDYYFRSNLSLMLLIKKACNVVFQSSKDEELSLSHEFFLIAIRLPHGQLWAILKTGFYPSTFVYNCFSPKIQFFYCLLS